MRGHHTKTIRRILVVAVALAVTTSVTAQTRRSDAERETLAHAVHELELIDSILEEAERRATGDARLFLDYERLRAELADVRGGIGEYIDGQRLQPRAVESLTADYVRLKVED